MYKITICIIVQEEIPRKMEVFTFVMHAPSDYFLDKTAPYRLHSELHIIQMGIKSLKTKFPVFYELFLVFNVAFD